MPDLPLKRDIIPLSVSINTETLFSFRVLQFNLLADGLSGLREDLGAFSRIERESIVWETRKALLLKEIVQYNPDIITVQECDHFDDYFEKELKDLGYIGLFAAKPNSPCLEVSDRADGCAILVKHTKISIRDTEIRPYTISSNDLRSALDKASSGSQTVEGDYENKQQNQLVVILHCAVETENGLSPVPLIIATTHLKATKSAEGEAVRYCEMKQLLQHMQAYAELNKPCAVLLTGDFNACPTNQQGDFRSITLELIREHPLRLRSVYNDDLVEELLKMRGDVASGENKASTEKSEIWTTWKGRVKENSVGSRGERVVKQCIDYILYQTPPAEAEGSRYGIVAKGVLGLYDASYMEKTDYLPSKVYPSDHIAIAADLEVVRWMK